MSTENVVTIIGNLTSDPEIQFVGSGAPVVKFGLAKNRRWQNRQTQEWEEEVSFFNVVTWQTLAENVAESLTKGTRVVVVGRLQQRSWETDDGDKRSMVEIVADEVSPSLKWATVEVTKNEREEPKEKAGASAGRSNGKGRSSRKRDYDDDEPF